MEQQELPSPPPPPPKLVWYALDTISQVLSTTGPSESELQEGIPKKQSIWWPAIYYHSHTDAIKDVYNKNILLSGAITNQDDIKWYQDLDDKTTTTTETDTDLENEIIYNLLRESIEPDIQIPVLSLLFPMIDETYGEKYKLQRRRIPYYHNDDNTLTSRSIMNTTTTKNHFIIREDFMTHFVGTISEQTKEKVGETLHIAFQLALKHIRHVLASHFSCVNKTIMKHVNHPKMQHINQIKEQQPTIKQNGNNVSTLHVTNKNGVSNRTNIQNERTQSTITRVDASTTTKNRKSQEVRIMREEKQVQEESISVRSVASDVDDSMDTTGNDINEIENDNESKMDNNSIHKLDSNFENEVESRNCASSISTSSFHENRKSFEEENLSLSDIVKPNDTWEEAWVRLQFAGWYTRVANYNRTGSSTSSTSSGEQGPSRDIWYVRTNTGPGSMENVDFFTSMEAIQQYVRDHSNWVWTPSVDKKRSMNSKVDNSNDNSKKGNKKTKKARVTLSPQPTNVKRKKGMNINPNSQKKIELPEVRTPETQMTKPQDPGKPLLSSEEHHNGKSPSSDASNYSGSSTSTTQDRYHWTILWDRLKRKGWKWRAGSGLASYIFIPPNGKVQGGIPGIDYFTSTEQVTNYILEKEGKNRNHPAYTIIDQQYDLNTCTGNNGRKRLPGKVLEMDKAVAVSGKNKNKKSVVHLTGNEKTKKNLKVPPPKKSATLEAKYPKPSTRENESSGSPKRPKALSKARLRQMKQETQMRKEHWWKYESLPSTTERIWPILQKLNYSKNEDGHYLLPPSALTEESHDPQFKSLHGLRKFLCWKGIPGFDQTSNELNSTEAKDLMRWAKFANVHVYEEGSFKILRNIPAPKTNNSILSLLHKMKFTSCGGNIFVPYSDKLPGGRSNRKEGIHYFSETNLNTFVRQYVRGAWHLGLVPYEVDNDDDEDEDNFHSQTSRSQSCSPSDMSKGSSSSLSIKNFSYMKPTEIGSGNNNNNNNDHSDLLQLSLWGATSSADLPPFNGCVQLWETRYLEEVVEGTEVLRKRDEVAMSPKREVKQSIERAVPSPKKVARNISKNNFATSESESEKELSDDESSEDDSVEQTTSPFWYKTTILPNFKDVWNILQKQFGYSWSGAYVHKKYTDIRFSSDLALQKYICKYGLAEYEVNKKEISDNDLLTVQRWVSFANVPVTRSNSKVILGSINVPSDSKIKSILLGKLGFKQVKDLFYPPGIDPNNKENILGVHVFKGIQGIQDYIRGAEEFYFHIEEKHSRVGRRAKQNYGGSEQDELMVRLWAATAPHSMKNYEGKRSDENEPVVTEKKLKVKSIVECDDIPATNLMNHTVTSSIPGSTTVDQTKNIDDSIYIDECQAAIHHDSSCLTEINSAKRNDASAIHETTYTETEEVQNDSTTDDEIQTNIHHDSLSGSKDIAIRSDDASSINKTMSVETEKYVESSTSLVEVQTNIHHDTESTAKCTGVPPIHEKIAIEPENDIVDLTTTPWKGPTNNDLDTSSYYSCEPTEPEQERFHTFHEQQTNGFLLTQCYTDHDNDNVGNDCLDTENDNVVDTIMDDSTVTNHVTVSLTDENIDRDEKRKHDPNIIINYDDDDKMDLDSPSSKNLQNLSIDLLTQEGGWDAYFD